jgi:hypothetical protein
MRVNLYHVYRVLKDSRNNMCNEVIGVIRDFQLLH